MSSELYIFVVAGALTWIICSVVRVVVEDIQYKRKIKADNKRLKEFYEKHKNDLGGSIISFPLTHDPNEENKK